MNRLPRLALSFALASFLGACSTMDGGEPTADAVETGPVVQYLEIVTSEVDATCAILEETHGIRFGAVQADLGNARTAAIAGGGRIAVRAPMADHEDGVVRPYMLVDDIESALATAAAQGAEIAMPATPMPGRGTFAIYILGGIQHGLWKIEG